MQSQIRSILAAIAVTLAVFFVLYLATGRWPSPIVTLGSMVFVYGAARESARSREAPRS